MELAIFCKMCFSKEGPPFSFLKFPDFLFFEDNTVCLSRNVKKQEEAEKIVIVFFTSLYSLGWGKANCWQSSLHRQQLILLSSLLDLKIWQLFLSTVCLTIKYFWNVLYVNFMTVGFPWCWSWFVGAEAGMLTRWGRISRLWTLPAWTME